MTWIMSFSAKPFYSKDVPTADHLLQEEVILHRQHLSANRKVPAKPNIDLFGYRRVEVPPAPIFHHQLRVVSRIAVDLAVHTRGLVLVEQVPDINTHPNLIEPGITLSFDLVFGITCCIIDEVVGFICPWHRENVLRHLL